MNLPFGEHGSMMTLISCDRCGHMFYAGPTGGNCDKCHGWNRSMHVNDSSQGRAASEMLAPLFWIIVAVLVVVFSASIGFPRGWYVIK
jgi:hypothetical protein